MNLSIQSHNLLTNGWNFMKPILNINDHGVVMYSKFRQDDYSNRVIAL